MEDNEYVKSIIGYEGLYTIDKDGKIFGIKKGKYLTPSKKKYPSVYLFKNDKGKSFGIHILVAKTFISNPDNKPIVGHVDDNKKNFSISNLEWVTYSENNKNAFKTGAKKVVQGENNTSAKFTNKEILEIYYAEGFRNKIAIHFDTVSRVIWKIKNKKTWTHLLENLDKVSFKNRYGYFLFQEKEIKFKLLKDIDLKDNRKEKQQDKLLPFLNKPIKGYINYLIDVCGNIYNLRTKKYMKINGKEYSIISLSMFNIVKTHRVNRLVAEAFILNPENKKIVNHKNGDKKDNRVENLEWSTYSENTKHSYEIGTSKRTNNTLKENDVLDIYYSDLSKEKLAEKYNVSISTVYFIKIVKSYKSILLKAGVKSKQIKTTVKLSEKEIVEIYYSKLSTIQLTEKYKAPLSTIRGIKNTSVYKKKLFKNGIKLKIPLKRNTNRVNWL